MNIIAAINNEDKVSDEIIIANHVAKFYYGVA